MEKFEIQKGQFKVKTRGQGAIMDNQIAPQGEASKAMKNYDRFAKSIVYAFVTLRSMEYTSTLKQAYNYKLINRIWIRLCCCCMRRENNMLDMRLIGGNWPSPSRAILPDNLMWKNMYISKMNRCVRIFI